MSSPGWGCPAKTSGRRVRVAAASLVMLGLSWAPTRGDEPGFLGRLFRGGQGNNSSSQAKKPGPADRGAPSPVVAPDSALRGGSPALLPPPTAGAPMTPAPSIPSYGGPAVRPGGAAMFPAGPMADTGAPAPAPPVQVPASASTTAAPAIRPQPRNARSATEADPILTRIMLGRTNDGSRFGMFLQIYEDGTVIDSEGVHRLPPEALRGVAQALQAPELGRVDGHCGGPPTDFVEEVQVVVYRRKLGGLVANSFSYSGNTAGCDPAIRALHTAVEALQARLSSPGDAGGSEAAPAVSGSLGSSAGPGLPTFSPAPPPTTNASPTLSLTPGL